VSFDDVMLQGWTSDKYWYYDPFPKPQEDNSCPYNFKSVMGKRAFLSITKCLVFTDIPPPCYCDKFWQVRQMIKAWNKNMVNNFLWCGWYVLTRACPFGTTSGRALAGSSALAILIILVMNTT
jgi:hypothetical protein